MSILNEIFLRYRAEGHVRFDIPPWLCTPDKAAALTAELQRLDGIYRVDIARRHRKLSIRYMPMVAGFDRLIKALGDIVKTLEVSSPPVPVGPGNLARHASPWLRSLNNTRPVRWAKEKFQEARETAAALRIIVRRVSNRSAPGHDPSDMLITFLNDVLVLYLIKVHWNLLTRLWLRRPFEYRYQWLAAFYLLFLLIRSRQASLR